ncbi:hypothetical protein JW916_04880 [Candidatus Sumerlaeota bacterium]|nr:hypothetical protein [Candidatus Sumerlaeota bacterium]
MPTPIVCPKCHNTFDFETTGDCPSCGWSTLEDDTPPGRFERSMRWVLTVSNVVLVVAMCLLFQYLSARKKYGTAVFFSIAVVFALLASLFTLRHIARREKAAEEKGDRSKQSKDKDRRVC